MSLLLSRPGPTCLLVEPGDGGSPSQTTGVKYGGGVVPRKTTGVLLTKEEEKEVRQVNETDLY